VRLVGNACALDFHIDTNMRCRKELPASRSA
jgi:hypothetical protein